MNIVQIDRPIITRDELDASSVSDVLTHNVINWSYILSAYTLTDEALLHFFPYMVNSYSADFIILHQNPNEDTIIQMLDHLIKLNNVTDHWFLIMTSIYKKLLTFNSLELILNKYNYDDYQCIWSHMDMNDEQMDYMLQHTNSFKEAAVFGKLSLHIIEKYKDKWNWTYIYKCQTLTEEFIEKMNHKTYWDVITSKQKYLSEEFIEKHSDEINFNWKNILRYQKNISEEFIEKHRSDILIAKRLKGGLNRK